MEKTMHGFVVAAGRTGHWFFRGFYDTEDRANAELRRTIDVNALQVVRGTVRFAATGNVQRWDMTHNDGGNLRHETA